MKGKLSMRNLITEMARYGFRNKDIQKVIKCSEKTARNKINGITQFTYREAKEIKDKLFPNLNLEYLFADDTSVHRTA